ncbi:hypothetical protein [Roseovarius sp. ZX-A-9]|uniref:hypothetical protein n=1 Tax=Roseovarius sp. ZX-A-9 TaxID=3014783 RepID=UPI00232F8EB9|nr:hypothetical protein [Roseovarius sp. ZX-A-9]
MKAFIQWLVFLCLLAALFVPAYLGMQFTDFPIYLVITGAVAFVIVLIMRAIKPSDQSATDDYERTGDT